MLDDEDFLEGGEVDLGNEPDRLARAHRLADLDDAPDPEEGLIMDSLRMEIERALHHLSEREAEVLRLFYGLNGHVPYSLDEIGARFDLTRERVRQIKEKGIQKLKSATRNKMLKKYLG